jgi:REP element-mobilizing transposase RayT
VFLPKRNKGPNALRRGRVSIPHADYFTTLCLAPRLPVLVPLPAEAFIAAAHRFDAEGLWRLRCFTVMPDHAHLFFTLGSRLTLSQVFARLKRETRSELRVHNTDWQENYYDHRLRPADSREATIRYIWLNPYRAGLISATETWPCFYCCAEDWEWFVGLTDKGLPDPGWLC